MLIIFTIVLWPSECLEMAYIGQVTQDDIVHLSDTSAQDLLGHRTPACDSREVIIITSHLQNSCFKRSPLFHILFLNFISSLVHCIFQFLDGSFDTEVEKSAETSGATHKIPWSHICPGSSRWFQSLGVLVSFGSEQIFSKSWKLLLAETCLPVYSSVCKDGKGLDRVGRY